MKCFDNSKIEILEYFPKKNYLPSVAEIFDKIELALNCFSQQAYTSPALWFTLLYSLTSQSIFKSNFAPAGQTTQKSRDP